MLRYAQYGLLILLVVAVVACKKEPPKPKPEDQQVKIPTQEEIAGEFKSAYSPLVDAVAKGTDVPRELGASIASAIGSAKAKNAAQQNGPAAIAQVTTELEDLLKNAKTKELWGAVVSLCDALAAVDPQNGKIERYREHATLELNRPVVTIKSTIKIPDHSEKTTFFVDIYLPEKKTVESKQISVGDEVLGLRFVDVIGNDDGIRFEYKATGDKFDVMRTR